MKIELYNDNFQNYKAYNVPTKAQLLIADIPYNIGSKDAYGSNPQIWKDKKVGGEYSEKYNKAFFKTDTNFNIAEFFHFATKMLKAEPKGVNEAPVMIIFCAYQQLATVAEYGKKNGFKKSYPLYFIKRNSPQVLKVNVKILGAVETGLLLYRDKLPKFRNEGRMVLNWFEFSLNEKPRIHPTQKPVSMLKKLIRLFTDEGDTVIDPVAGSGSTLRACMELNRNCYGFEVDKKYCREAREKMLKNVMTEMF